jgi:hypothetical protein
VFAKINILGFNLGELNIEFQFITSKEVERRLRYFGKSDPCGIQCDNFDDKGLCTDSKKGMRPIDSFILHQGPGNYLMLAFQYKADMLFPLLQLLDAHFYFTIDVKKPSNYFLQIGAKIRVLFVFDEFVYVFFFNSF